MSAAEKTAEEIAREKRARDCAELDALWRELYPKITKGRKSYTLDEVLELCHLERATGEGYEKLWAIEPTSTQM